MRVPTKSSYLILYGVVALFLILLIVAGVQTCQEVKSIEKKVNEKFDQFTITPNIPISAHDIAIQKTSDSIEKDRKIQHVRVDALAKPALQGWLDSLFNMPGGYDPNGADKPR